MDSGYIRLKRDLKKSEIWLEDSSFGHRDALIDFFLNASAKPKKVIFKGDAVDLDQGEFVTSQGSLCLRFRWSRQKVRTFLQKLESSGIIMIKTSRKNTIIRVVDYEQYLDDVKPVKSNVQNSEDKAKEPLLDVDNSFVTRSAAELCHDITGIIITHSDAIEELNDVIKKVGTQLFVEACKIAKENGAYSYRYVIKVALGIYEKRVVEQNSAMPKPEFHNDVEAPSDFFDKMRAIGNN